MEAAAAMLPVHEAFALATTWRRRLQGCIALEEDMPPVDSGSIFQTIEWVSITISSPDALRKAACARATAIVWTALSCCRGFSGTENPQFWLRLLTRWDEPRLGFEDEDEDARGRTRKPPNRNVRFFPSATERAFPRIKLSPPSDDSSDCERIFLGISSCLDTACDAQLHAALAQLEPFVERWYSSRRITVAIDTSPGSKIARLLEEYRFSEAHRIVDVGLPLSYPRFEVTTIVADRFLSGQELAVLAADLSLANVDVVRAAQLHQIVLDHRLFPVLLHRRFPRQQLACHANQLPWLVSRVRQTLKSDEHTALLCSALPHIDTIQCLEVAATGEAFSSPSDWAWLGYALFHPDAASRSGLTSLHIDLRGVSEEALDAFQNMAIGNNLPTDLTKDAVSFQYVEGYVGEEGAEVWSLPGVQDRILQSTIEKTWVTLCIPSLEDINLDEKWICVVNPGFGFGQLRIERLSDLRSRLPGTSSIQILRIGSIANLSTSQVNPERQQQHEQSVKVLLNRLGDKLIAVDWHDSTNEVSVSAMQDLRRFCPSLESLRIHHNGAVWTDASDQLSWVKLQELELISSAKNSSWRQLQPLRAQFLPRLEALKILGQSNSFASCKDTLVALMQSHDTLRYLSWKNHWTLIRTPPPTEVTAKQAFEEQVHAMQRNIVRSPRVLTRRLAFLSSISDAASLSAARQICSEIAAVIFSFEPIAVRREFYIDL